MDDRVTGDAGRMAEVLREAAACLAAAQPGDQEAIAASGAALEACLVAMPPGAPHLAPLLNLVLDVLQQVFLGQAEEAEARQAEAAAVLEAVTDWCEAGMPPDGAERFLAAAYDLWVALGRDPESSPFPWTKPVVVGSAPAITCLDDAMALLIGLAPDDTEALGHLRDGLSRLGARSDWPAPVCQAVAEAQAALAPGAGEPAAALATALAALAVAAEALAAEREGAALQAPPDPLPSEPVCLEFSTDADLLGEFVNECLDHLQRAELALLDVEADSGDREALNAVFRGFHTIKGTAGFLGLAHIQRLAHHAEALLDRAREGEIPLTGGYADLALEAADRLKGLIAELQDYVGAEPPPEPADLADLVARLSAPESHGITAAADALPAITPRVGDILVVEGKASREMVEAVARDPEDERIGRKLVTHAAAHTRDVARALRAQKQSGEGGADGFVRVRTDRLDALINMVGELVIANAMLTQDDTVQAHAFRSLGRKVGQVDKITRELQDLGMSMRMVPLRSAFQKMSRLVRDLAHKFGKEVQLVTEGEDTEIDRTMVEALGDPLLHMVRNAVDHGLEPPEERRTAGKPPCGTLTLRAYHAAGSVVIELRDDGRGLDRQRILAKAVANGVVEAGRELSDPEVYRLVFAPGLSTAELVTDVSGRGVGMDVVMRNIEALRGRVDIASTPGEGTTFVLRIPLTLAIMDGMLVQVGQERYIVPTVSIQQSFRAGAEDVTTVAGRGEMVAFRGNLAPVVRLHRLYRVSGATPEIERGLLLAVECDGERYALLVDQLLGQQQIVIKSLGRALGQVPGVSGSAILSDGRVGLILDVQGLLELARDADAEPYLGKEADPCPAMLA